MRKANYFDEPAGFVIDNDSKAEWALGIIAKQRRETERLVNVCKDQADYYKRRAEKIMQEGARKTGDLECMLRAYFDGVAHKKSKTAESYKLPSGKLALKNQESTYKLNNGELLMWLDKNMPECVKVERSPMWGELKKRVVISGNEAIYPDTGEVVPGVTVEQREPEFVIEANMPEVG